MRLKSEAVKQGTDKDADSGIFMPTPFAAAFLNRRSLAAIFLTAVALLSALTGAGYGPPIWWAGIAAWLAALLLWGELARKQQHQALLLAGIGFLAFGIALMRGNRPAWLGPLTQNTALLGMLASVSFLQLLGTSDDEETPLPTGKLALFRTAIGTHLLGAVINLSGLYIVAERIGAQGKPNLDQAALLSRVFLAAALWSPFFAAYAVAMTYAPGANAFGVAVSGILLALVLIGLAVHDIITASDDRALGFVGYPMQRSAFYLPGVLVLLVGAGHWIFPQWSTLTVISIAALMAVGVASIFRQGLCAGCQSIARHAGQRLPGMAGELILFLAAGCFASGLGALIGESELWMPFTKFGTVEAALVLAIMVVLAAIGIHAIVSITVIATWLAPLDPSPTLLAMVFVQSWAVGLVVAPTSGTILSIQGRYGLSALSLVRKNFRYCLKAYAAAVFCLAIVGYCLGA